MVPFLAGGLVMERRPRVAVYGDLMLDRDFVVDRDVAEDLPRFKVVESRVRLGAAGAVVNMLQSLGCDTMLASTSGGSDADVSGVQRMIPGAKFVMRDNGQQTQRIRYWDRDGKRLAPRVDIDGRTVLSNGDERALCASIGSFRPDIIVVCDHGRGVVTPSCIGRLKSFGAPIYVDPCIKSNWESFGGVEVLSMNRQEALECAAIDPEPKEIIQHCDVDGLWWYRSGWWLAPPAVPGESDSHRLWFPSMATEVVDTLGAGDQFMATLAAGRAKGQDWECAILEANIAAGLQCGRRGIVPVTWAEIRNSDPSRREAGASSEPSGSQQG